jgi:hypothetical protein
MSLGSKCTLEVEMVTAILSQIQEVDCLYLPKLKIGEESFISSDRMGKPGGRQQETALDPAPCICCSYAAGQAQERPCILLKEAGVAEESFLFLVKILKLQGLILVFWRHLCRTTFPDLAG